jgi:CP family cyanate transporter-like MFS transporter
MTRSDGAKLLLLWWAGISLRVTVLAVPPLLPIIHHQLHLDETEIGALTALPVFLLALAAVPGSLLVARLGARHAILLGMALIAVAGAARGIGGSAVVLFGATLLMGCGIAACQPALPALVRFWLPQRIGQATAGYSNGILVGEILPVAVTASLFAGLFGGWQWALAVWSIPVVATAICILLFSKNEPVEFDAPPARWWPDWRDRRVWCLGLALGGASAAYWSANAFVPELLRHSHHSAFITPALTSLNLGQIPASLLVAFAPTKLVAKAWPLVAAGAMVALTSVGILLLPPGPMIADEFFLGLAAASVFVLVLSLPPLVADPGDVHRLSAAMFTISYVCPFLGSLIGGALWDASGIPQAAFLTLVVGGVMVMIFASRLDLGSARDRLLRVEPLDEPVLPA